MWRYVLGGLVVAIIGYYVLQWIHVSDTERVEAELQRLVELAREGGPEAAEEILAALADDYRGSYPYTRKNIANAVTSIVGASRIESLTVGDFKVVSKGDEILVPLFRVTAVPQGTIIVILFFGRQGDDWKLVDVKRWKM